jgi:hypothetical protein
MHSNGTSLWSAMRLSSVTIVFAAAAASYVPGAWAEGSATMTQSTELLQPSLKAPKGHRQPRPADLSTALTGDEESVIQDQRKLDRQLTICRGC